MLDLMVFGGLCALFRRLLLLGLAPWVAVPFDFASLRLTHGLRPMHVLKSRFACIYARKPSFHLMRTALANVQNVPGLKDQGRISSCYHRCLSASHGADLMECGAAARYSGAVMGVPIAACQSETGLSRRRCSETIFGGTSMLFLSIQSSL